MSKISLPVIYQNERFSVDPSQLFNASGKFRELISKRGPNIHNIQLKILYNGFTTRNIENFLKICQNQQTDTKNSELSEMCLIAKMFQANKILNTALTFIQDNFDSNFTIPTNPFDSSNGEEFLLIEDIVPENPATINSNVNEDELNENCDQNQTETPEEKENFETDNVKNNQNTIENQKVNNINIEEDQKVNNINIEEDQKVNNINIEEDQKFNNINIEENQKFNNINIEENQDLNGINTEDNLKNKDDQKVNNNKKDDSKINNNKNTKKQEDNETPKKKLPSVYYEISYDNRFMKCRRFYLKKDGKIIYMAKQKNSEIYIGAGEDFHISENKYENTAKITRDSKGYNIISTDDQEFKIKFLKDDEKYSLNISFVHKGTKINWTPKKSKSSSSFKGEYNHIPISSKRNMILQNQRNHTTFILRKMTKKSFECECNQGINPIMAFSIALSQIIGPISV